MPSLEDSLRERFERINSVPEEFVTQVEKSQREIFEKIFEKLETLDRTDGKISLTKQNLAKIEEFGEDLKKIIQEGDSKYSKAVNEFIGEFSTQKDIVKNFFESEFDFANKPVYDTLAKNAETTSYDLVANSAVDSHVSEFKDMLQTAVGSSDSYTDTVKNLRTLIEGNDKIDGGMLKYAKQNAKDLFSVSDRQYSKAIADGLGIEFFQYSGGTIKTTRPFCDERNGKIFSKKEIEQWGAGKKTTGLSLPFASGGWDGKAAGTTKVTIFSLCGGYNCEHVLLPVALKRVPIDVIERNIEQGFIKEKDLPAEILEKMQA